MQFVHEFLRLLGDAAAQDNEIRPQQRMIFIDDRIQFIRPCSPAQIAVDFRAPGGALFSFASPDLQVAKFGVRHQPAIDKECAADTRAQGQQQNRARDIARRTVVQFCQTRRVRVIDGDYRPFQVPGGELRQRLTDPRLVEIRRGGTTPSPRITLGNASHGVVAEYSQTTVVSARSRASVESCAGVGVLKRSPANAPVSKSISAHFMDSRRRRRPRPRRGFVECRIVRLPREVRSTTYNNP